MKTKTQGEGGYQYKFTSEIRPLKSLQRIINQNNAVISIVHSSLPWGTGVEVDRSHTACHRMGSWACSHPCGEGAHTWEEEEVGEDRREDMRAFHSHCKGCSMVWRERGEGGRGRESEVGE